MASMPVCTAIRNSRRSWEFGTLPRAPRKTQAESTRIASTASGVPKAAATTGASRIRPTPSTE